MYGANTYRDTAATSTAVNISAKKSEVRGFNCINGNDEAVYLKLYDAAAPTVGTTVPAHTFYIPVGAAFALSDVATPFRFSTALSFAVTKLIADSDTTAPDGTVYLEVYWV